MVVLGKLHLLTSRALALLFKLIEPLRGLMSLMSFILLSPIMIIFVFVSAVLRLMLVLLNLLPLMTVTNLFTSGNTAAFSIRLFVPLHSSTLVAIRLSLGTVSATNFILSTTASTAEGAIWVSWS